jgi:hypothetical protein
VSRNSTNIDLENEHHDNNLSIMLRKTKILRISSLPPTATYETVRLWLDGDNQLARINLAPLEVVQLSIAPRSSAMQATVTLKDLPIEIGKSLGELQGPSSASVVVDDHFLGLTVLYEATNTHPKAE